MESWSVAILGDAGVGKTTLAIQTPYDPTIEVYSKQFMVDNRICFVEVIDTSGFDLEEYLSAARENQGFILVYSIASRVTFERLDIFIKLLKAKLKKPTFILVANKSDKIDQREVSREEGIAFAKICGCEFMEASASTAYNVEFLFQNLVRALRQARAMTRSGSRRKQDKKKPVKCVVM
ncbi:P-loop containing nucleoside triphosphate hydrolase protein [Suillus clintonianus]|uniref:P-loop containing nucleoside triphosphate hydrolase protein n=1 Tax=Suillus clintonianus TaxID=1904413 RepID=UPI001B8816BD|nr:P-loop containing nucleoside triphosphate hydrolase protein [Suillus clintonianus]KAG2133361.1 P-loop containing nucleoside triphosphate hydrolase protein [Suillus clintonianus]